jgi:hypothetical protein
MGVLIYCSVKETESLVKVTQRVVATALAIIDTWVFRGGIQIQTLSKVFDSLVIPARLELGDTPPVVWFCENIIECDGRVEIGHSKLVVTHILVDEPPRNKHALIFRQLLEDIAEALEGLVELVGPVVHQSQVEPTGDEGFGEREGLLVHGY